MKILSDLKDRFMMLTKKDKIIFLSLVGAIIIIVIALLILIPKLFNEGESGGDNNNGRITANTVTSTIIGGGDHPINAEGKDYLTDYMEYDLDVYNKKKIKYTLNKDFSVEIRVSDATVNGASGYEYKFKVNGGNAAVTLKSEGDTKLKTIVAHDKLYLLKVDPEEPGNGALYVFNKKGNIIKGFGDMNTNASGLHVSDFEVSNETGLVIYTTREKTNGFIYYGSRTSAINICDEKSAVKVPSATAITAKYIYSYVSTDEIDFNNYRFEQGVLKDQYINEHC